MRSRIYREYIASQIAFTAGLPRTAVARTYAARPHRQKNGLDGSDLSCCQCLRFRRETESHHGFSCGRWPAQSFWAANGSPSGGRCDYMPIFILSASPATSFFGVEWMRRPFSHRTLAAEMYHRIPRESLWRSRRFFAARSVSLLSRAWFQTHSWPVGLE